MNPYIMTQTLEWRIKCALETLTGIHSFEMGAAAFHWSPMSFTSSLLGTHINTSPQHLRLAFPISPDILYKGHRNTTVYARPLDLADNFPWFSQCPCSLDPIVESLAVGVFLHGGPDGVKTLHLRVTVVRMPQALNSNSSNSSNNGNNKKNDNNKGNEALEYAPTTTDFYACVILCFFTTPEADLRARQRMDRWYPDDINLCRDPTFKLPSYAELVASEKKTENCENV
jgi:hypothetical protein